MRKDIAREIGLQNREKLTEKERLQKSHTIFQKLLPYLTKAQHVGCYISMGSEVDTKEIISFCLDHNIQLSVPKVEKGTLSFYLIDRNTTFLKSKFGVKEPVDGTLINICDINLMIVPLSAYDQNFNRTGYGKGYYDSILDKCLFKVGVAFEEQYVSEIDTASHDVCLNLIVCG